MHSRSLGQNFVEMNKTKQYLIPFVGLKLGKHHFEYQISNASQFSQVWDITNTGSIVSKQNETNAAVLSFKTTLEKPENT